MRVRHRLLNIVAAVVATSAIIIVFAQEPQKQSTEKSAESAQDNQSESKRKEEDTPDCIFRITTYIPAIRIIVTDGNNRSIPDLAPEDFAIFENDIEQQIISCSRDDSSLSISLAFDISDNERLKLMARQVAWSFVSQIRSTDEVAIPQLGAGNEKARDFAADEPKLKKALSEISSKNKLTDIVAEAIKSWWPAMIVITDGLSLSGTARDKEAAYEILRRNKPVYFIILDDGSYRSRPANQSSIRQTRNLLMRLAEVSGALALVVKNEAEISAATEKIIHRLKNQYTMAYTSKFYKFDGSFRYLRVRVTPKDKRKVRVFAPLGYYAVDPEKISEEKTNDK